MGLWLKVLLRRFGEEVVIANDYGSSGDFPRDERSRQQSICGSLAWCPTRTPWEIAQQRGTTMRTSGMLGLAGLALAILALDASAQMGGAVRGGVRGAAVGQMVGGDSA